MSGHNHYPWCMCGWCYKKRINGYGERIAIVDPDKSYAMRTLQNYGADKSWTACFVIPNASCPVCGAKVYYYQNQYGSRVYFDELGRPWPKHRCTDSVRWTTSRRTADVVTVTPIVRRRHGEISEIMTKAKMAGFDPNAAFRSAHGHSPFDLLIILEIRRVVFKNLIKAESVSPSLEDPVFISFTSAKITPVVGEYFSFDGSNISLLDQKSLIPYQYEAREITLKEFATIEK